MAAPEIEVIPPPSPLSVPMPFPKPNKGKKIKGRPLTAALDKDVRMVITFTLLQQKIDKLKDEAVREVEAEDYDFFAKIMIGAFMILTALMLFAPEFIDYQKDYFIFYLITTVILLWQIRTFARWYHPRHFKSSREQCIWDKTDVEVRKLEEIKDKMPDDELADEMNYVFGGQFMRKDY